MSERLRIEFAIREALTSNDPASISVATANTIPHRLCTECGVRLPVDRLHVCRECREAA